MEEESGTSGDVPCNDVVSLSDKLSEFELKDLTDSSEDDLTISSSSKTSTSSRSRHVKGSSSDTLTGSDSAIEQTSHEELGKLIRRKDKISNNEEISSRSSDRVVSPSKSEASALKKKSSLKNKPGLIGVRSLNNIQDEHVVGHHVPLLKCEGPTQEQSSTSLCSRSDNLSDPPCLSSGDSKRKMKKTRFSHEVKIMYFNEEHERPPTCCIVPLAEEYDQQERSYKKRFRLPVDKVYYPRSKSSK